MITWPTYRRPWDPVLFLHQQMVNSCRSGGQHSCKFWQACFWTNWLEDEMARPILGGDEWNVLPRSKMRIGSSLVELVQQDAEV